MENKKQMDAGMQVEITSDVAMGTYANMAMVVHSSSEVIMDFLALMPGVPKAHVKSRIVMTPEHAKRFLFALQDNIYKYETHFGEIELNKGMTGDIPPFNMNKGEA